MTQLAGPSRATFLHALAELGPRPSWMHPLARRRWDTTRETLVPGAELHHRRPRDPARAREDSMSKWVDLAALRERIRRAAEALCADAGLELARVRIEIAEPAPNRPRPVTIHVESRHDLDLTEPRFRDIWEDN